MLVGGHGEANPNTSWFQSRGLWFSYCLGVITVHIILLSIPFLTVPIAWTITNVLHNSIHLIFLHTLKGTPWLSQDQGECRRLTHWEQIDDGLQFTKTKKFLSVMPIILFFLTNFYTKYDPVHFYINFISLVVVLLPKLPHFHENLGNDIPFKRNSPAGSKHLQQGMKHWNRQYTKKARLAIKNDMNIRTRNHRNPIKHLSAMAAA